MSNYQRESSDRATAGGSAGYNSAGAGNTSGSGQGYAGGQNAAGDYYSYDRSAGANASGNGQTYANASGQSYAGGQNGTGTAGSTYGAGANASSGSGQGYAGSQNAAGDYYNYDRSAGDPRSAGAAGFGQAFTYSVNTSESDDVEIDLGELFAVLLHWLWLICLVGLLCGIAGYLFSSYCIAETFLSTTKIYVLDKNDSSNTSTYTELQTGSQLTNDYAEIITSRAVLEQVMEANGLLDIYSYDSFAEKIEVDVPDSTRIVSITVTDTDPAMAQKLANEIRIAASELILETMQIDAVNTFEEANYPTEKAAPSNGRNALIAALIGAILVAAVVIIRYLLDDTVKTSEDVERYLRLSTLALIPLDENVAGEEKKTRKRRSRAGSGSGGEQSRSRAGSGSGGTHGSSRTGSDGSRGELRESSAAADFVTTAPSGNSGHTVNTRRSRRNSASTVQRRNAEDVEQTSAQKSEVHNIDDFNDMDDINDIGDVEQSAAASSDSVTATTASATADPEDVIVINTGTGKEAD